MKVKEAQKLIANIDNEIKNLEKLLLLNSVEKEALAEKIGLNNTVDNMVLIGVNSMLSWKSVLQDKINDAEIYCTHIIDKNG
jgi:glutaredoxin 2